MDIAAMSIDMSLARVQQNVGLSIAKKAMDSQEIATAGLFEMVEGAIPAQVPVDGIGQILDVRG